MSRQNLPKQLLALDGVKANGKAGGFSGRPDVMKITAGIGYHGLSDAILLAQHNEDREMESEVTRIFRCRFCWYRGCMT